MWPLQKMPRYAGSDTGSNTTSHMITNIVEQPTCLLLIAFVLRSDLRAFIIPIEVHSTVAI